MEMKDINNSVWHGACLHVLLTWHSGCCPAVITITQKDKWSRGKGGALPGTCSGTLTPPGVPVSSCQSLDPNLGSSLTCSPALPTLLTPAPLKQSRYATITDFLFLVCCCCC